VYVINDQTVSIKLDGLELELELGVWYGLGIKALEYGER
jgi:hypothetical protein